MGYIFGQMANIFQGALSKKSCFEYCFLLNLANGDIMNGPDFFAKVVNYSYMQPK